MKSEGPEGSGYCTLLHAHPAVPRLSDDSGGLSEAVSLAYLKTRLFVSPSTCKVSSSFPAGRILSDSRDSGDHPEDDPSWLLQRGGGDDRRQKGSKKEHSENEWLMVRYDSSSDRGKEQRCERWRPQGAAEGWWLLLLLLS
ncbi:MAG: hypothetical protein Q9204_001519 [Flavoplaca sp. TL-2023a]